MSWFVGDIPDITVSSTYRLPTSEQAPRCQAAGYDIEEMTEDLSLLAISNYILGTEYLFGTFHGVLNVQKSGLLFALESTKSSFVGHTVMQGKNCHH